MFPNHIDLRIDLAQTQDLHLRGKPETCSSMKTEIFFWLNRVFISEVFLSDSLSLIRAAPRDPVTQSRNIPDPASNVAGRFGAFVSTQNGGGHFAIGKANNAVGAIQHRGVVSDHYQRSFTT